MSPDNVFNACYGCGKEGHSKIDRPSTKKEPSQCICLRFADDCLFGAHCHRRRTRGAEDLHL